ncbi:hypothetical protein CFN78_11690 [Amycolatopsis antarctica]|uniref:GAP family protein n=1 Tax=Amycolatopsis antarctica TaxID=1854586 RepID=A0A263D4C4_9PSEU|nr:GAP family protein [Amycolatopsis antarctica]OZM72918.1 hypothetical protein CFN78_11690 [Amycolatopsis antarctica]
MAVPAIIAAVLGLALLDSLNPSVIAVTIFLLVKRAPAPVAAGNQSGDVPPEAAADTRPADRWKSPVVPVLTYLSAVVGTYFVIGVLILLGLSALGDKVQKALNSAPAWAVTTLLGLAMLTWAVVGAVKDKREPDRHRNKKSRMPVSDRLGPLFALGLVVSVIEFATALPFLASIGIMTANSLSWTLWLPLLAMHVLVMVLPELLLLVTHQVLKSRIEQWMERTRAKLAKNSRANVQLLVGIVGFFVFTEGVGFFAELWGLTGTN